MDPTDPADRTCPVDPVDPVALADQAPLLHSSRALEVHCSRAGLEGRVDQVGQAVLVCREDLVDPVELKVQAVQAGRVGQAVQEEQVVHMFLDRACRVCWAVQEVQVGPAVQVVRPSSAPAVLLMVLVNNLQAHPV